MDKPIVKGVGLTKDEANALDAFENLDDLNDDIFEESPLFDEYGDLNEDWERIVEESGEFD